MENNKCWQGDDEYHRCSALHCDYCGKCPATRKEDQQPAEGWENVAWHEVSCPAHSNQMQSEDKCNCLFSFAKEFIAQAQADKAEEIINDIPDNSEEPYYNLPKLKQQLRQKHLTNPN